MFSYLQLNLIMPLDDSHHSDLPEMRTYLLRNYLLCT